MSRNRSPLFFLIITLTVSTCLCFLAGEIILRKIDGYPLFSIRLKAKPPSQTPFRSQIPYQEYLSKIPLADTIEADWFMLDPRPLPQKPSDPFLSFLMDKAKGTEATMLGGVNKQFNRVFLLDQIQNKGPLCEYFLQFPEEAVVFEPCENSPYPAYRFPPNVTMPSGLRTNNFGWRGEDIDLNKPANTIRLCFLGASTTIGHPKAPYSYPEFIGNWLNIWAKKNNMHIRFETINAGREGITSPVTAAIFKQEVLPLEPDFVIYYEASNQFEFYPLIKNFDSLPGPDQYEKKNTLYLLSRIARYSAVAQRLKTLWLKINKSSNEREPDKPPYVLSFPEGLDTDNPDIARTDLPLNMSSILKDLDDINQQAAGSNCHFSLVSFVFLPYDGMLLDRQRYEISFWHLNRFFWPLRYADIQRLGDFQNNVFKTYAQQRDINFIDLSGSFPRLPDLFYDAVHFNDDGIRLQAWIILQAIIPHIRNRIERGELPRPDREFITEHPCIRPGIRNGFAEVLKLK
jgi:hypothetical protein